MVGRSGGRTADAQPPDAQADLARTTACPERVVQRHRFRLGFERLVVELRKQHALWLHVELEQLVCAGLREQFLVGIRNIELRIGICIGIRIHVGDLWEQRLDDVELDVVELRSWFVVGRACPSIVGPGTRVHRLVETLNSRRKTTLSERRQCFDALGDEAWRQYIDRDHQHHGPMVYDLGLHGREPEPGFLVSIAAAHRLASSKLGRPMDRRHLQELHEAASRHARPPLRYRGHDCHLTVDRGRVEPGAERWLAKLGVRVERDDDERRPRVRIVFRAPRGGPGEIVEMLEKELDTCSRALACTKSEDGRIAAIARLHQRIEILHPTEDGNTRRDLVILNKLLVDVGLTPTILDEPNDVYVVHERAWAEAIFRGMDRWREGAEAARRGGDVAEALRRHDRRLVRADRAPDPEFFPDRGWVANGLQRVRFA